MNSNTTSPYQMAVNNMAAYLKKVNPLDEGAMNAFDLSAAAAVMFCKNKEEILADIINVNNGK